MALFKIILLVTFGYVLGGHRYWEAFYIFLLICLTVIRIVRED